MPTRRWALAALLALTPAACSRPGTPPIAACRLDHVADLPIDGRSGYLIVPARLDGIQVAMILDTGAEGMMLSDATVARLHIPRDPAHTTQVLGTGGTTLRRNASPQSFELAGMRFPEPSVTVGPLALPTRMAPPVAGVIGGDVLTRFDVEIDLAADRVTLWRHTGCPAAVPNWTGAWQTLALQSSRATVALTTLRVLGHPMRAIIDTGSPHSLLDSNAAGSLGIGPATLAQDPAATSQGTDMRVTRMRIHDFADVDVGGAHFPDVQMLVGKLSLRFADMLLGADFLQAGRLWISYSTHAAFFQPAGAAGM